jgi:thiopeptide-type bacteriocin biosynthesis protein
MIKILIIMKLKIMKTAVCRTPAFSTVTVIEDVWEDLKLKIKESSPTFYQSIKDYESGELDTINRKIWFTIWKYFTRAKYRATPFGSFSAISLVSISEKKLQQIKISNKMQIHSFRDWSEVDAFTDNKTKLLSDSTLVYTNSSVYYVNDEIRYIRFRNEKFEIASVISLPELLTILESCSLNQTISNILKIMKAKFKMNHEDTIGLLRQMLSLQLIITEGFPNIIGQDYFTRMESKKSMSDINYLISERTILSGQLCSQQLGELTKLIDFLATTLPDTHNNTLNDFKTAFRKKFEQREIPLSCIMDPEIGIGYGNLEQQLTNDVLNIFRTIENEEIVTISYSAFHTFILNRLILSKPIQLEEFSSEENTSKQTLPNTLSVLLHFWNGTLVIENMGGSTANSLLGRFTLADEKFENFAKSIANIEEKANPDVIFFDIAYQAEKKIDNVNRRKKIYEQELPILTWSCTSEPLDFNDILVSVQGATVVLRSKKHRKRLVPRIPSAYNYTRSDLAVYRFLCDIQNQDLKINLNFNPRNYFPYLMRYPRVNFKTLIVSPAMWLVPKEFIGNMSTGVSNSKIEDLSKWLESESIDFLFKAGDTDSTLCFDSRSPNDIKAFLMYCKQQTNELYISEALISDDGWVRNEKGENYSAQFIVNYYHEQSVYERLVHKKGIIRHDSQTKRIFLPGSDWLYYELYCYPTRSNNLLLGQLNRFLKEVKPYIKKWFFIRYDLPSPHLRLRLHLNEPSLASLINSKLLKLIEPCVNSGQVNDVCIKTYTREIERYGAERMESIEKFFYIDSRYALSLLAKITTKEQLYIITLYFIHNVFLANFNSINEQIAFVKKMADNFAKEIEMTPIQFRELNQAFNLIKNDKAEMELLSKEGVTLIYKKALAGVFIGMNKEEKLRLIGDLIHMHINRLFSSDQRLHETVLYHYLLRHLMAHRARISFQEVN